MRTNPLRMKSLALVVALAGLSAGCQLILDFNRSLIDGGTVDGSFFDDSGAPGDDSGVDALPVPDAVADVDFVESSTSDDTGAADAAADAKGDATLDASPDARADAVADAHAEADAAHDAVADGTHADAPVDASKTTDAVSDAPDAG